jgi:hypothetical protein
MTVSARGSVTAEFLLLRRVVSAFREPRASEQRVLQVVSGGKTSKYAHSRRVQAVIYESSCASPY